MFLFSPGFQQTLNGASFAQFRNSYRVSTGLTSIEREHITETTVSDGFPSPIYLDP